MTGNSNFNRISDSNLSISPIQHLNILICWIFFCADALQAGLAAAAASASRPGRSGQVSLTAGQGRTGDSSRNRRTAEAPAPTAGRYRHPRRRHGTPERLLQGTGRAKAQPAVAGRRPAEPADNEVRPTEYPGLREQQAPRNRRRRNRR